MPHRASDAELLEWWGKDASVTSGMVSLLFAVFTAVLFAVVTNHVLLLAGERSRHWAAFARSMAAAFTATLLVSAALRGGIGHLVKVEDGPLPGIDVLRYTTALNYTVLAMVVMTTFALTAIALGVLVLRTASCPVAGLRRDRAGCSGARGGRRTRRRVHGAGCDPLVAVHRCCDLAPCWRRDARGSSRQGRRVGSGLMLLRITTLVAATGMMLRTRTGIMSALALVGLPRAADPRTTNPVWPASKPPPRRRRARASSRSPTRRRCVAVVGTWERTQTCAELVAVLTDNGMEPRSAVTCRDGRILA